ncbi:UNVERIFIED_CONTAM: hypothetical protein K2H54_061475 [Gekko kuhli]
MQVGKSAILRPSGKGQAATPTGPESAAGVDARSRSRRFAPPDPGDTRRLGFSKKRRNIKRLLHEYLLLDQQKLFKNQKCQNQ